MGRPDFIAARKPRHAVIASNMAINEVFGHLIDHGCNDFTQYMPQQTGQAHSGGHFGDVYKLPLGIHGNFAVKCFRLPQSESNPKVIKRAARELYYWSKVKHENILELQGTAICNGQLAMISPWMDNGTLQHYAWQNPRADHWSMCLQLTNGLVYLHDIGMVHGDLKAVNVLVSRKGIVKIGDFGNSLLEESSLGFTSTSSIGGGTYRWMAYELVDYPDSEPPVHKSTMTDVFSLGMTILEVLSGRVPYHERTTSASVIAALIRRMLPNRPEQLSEEVEWGNQRWELLINCWDIDPMMRPTSRAVHRRMMELH